MPTGNAHFLLKIVRVLHLQIGTYKYFKSTRRAWDSNIQHGNPLAHHGHVVWECVFSNDTWFGRKQALAATACWESARGVWECSCGCDHRDFLDEAWVCEMDYWTRLPFPTLHPVWGFKILNSERRGERPDTKTGKGIPPTITLYARHRSKRGGASSAMTNDGRNVNTATAECHNGWEQCDDGSTENTAIVSIIAPRMWWLSPMQPKCPRHCSRNTSNSLSPKAKYEACPASFTTR